MKTTIDLDEDKLRRVMKLTGIKTRKEAIDFALSQAERLARIKKLFSRPLYVSHSDEIIDPSYDLMRLREAEKPGT
jgi:Arc/MetJ family transcription regulator